MSVRARIREVIRAGVDQSPREVATTVLHELPDDELRAALDVALPYLVSDEIRKHRHEAIGRPPRRGQETHERFAKPDSIDPVTTAKRRAAGKKATKAAQAKRDRDSLLLRTPVALGPGKWKALGDLTAEDLRAVASNLRERAEECSTKAGRYEAIATWLEQEGLSTVRDLDGERIREVAGVA